MSPDQSLKYGMFLMPIHNPAKPKAQCYDEDLELIGRCEEWGFEEFWVGEHHTSSYENIVMPEIFLAKAFTLTERIRLGPAPICLQYHHPAQVAGRLAFLDHLCKGRLNLCFGPGAVPSDLEVHNVDPKHSGAMVAESIDMILKLWGERPPREMTGAFWDYSLKESVSAELGTGVVHRPFQLPHPPIAVPCMSRGSGNGQNGRRPGLSALQPPYAPSRSAEGSLDHLQPSGSTGRAGTPTSELEGCGQHLRGRLDVGSPTPGARKYCGLDH